MLKLLSLDLENFMCVKEAHLEFNKKIIVLQGDNGQGKTTVQNAIALCLNEDKKGDSYREYVKTDTDRSHVHLNALIYNQPITFDIVIEAKENTSLAREVMYKGTKYTNSEVSDLIKSLELDYYSDIIMSTQGADDDIVKMSPTQREKYLQKLLDFNLDVPLKTAKEKIDTISESVKYNKTQVQFNDNSIKAKKAEIKTEKKLPLTEKQIETLKSDIAKIESELVVFQEALNSKDQLQTDKLTCHSSIAGHEADIASLHKRVSDAQAAEQSIKDFNAKIREGKISISDMNDKITAFEKEMAEYETDKLYEEKDQLNQQTIKYRHTLDDLYRKQKLIQGGKCPTCEHVFESNEIEPVNKSITLTESESKEASDKLVKVTEKYNTNYNKKEELSKNIRQLKNLIASAENGIKMLENFKAQCNPETDKIGTWGTEIATHQVCIEDLKKRIVDIDNEIDTLTEKSQKYIEESKELKDMKSKLSEVDAIVLENKLTVENNEKINQAITKLNEAITEAKKNIDTLSVQLKAYNTAYKLIDKDLANYVVIKTCKRIEHAMNNFIQVVFPKIETRLFQNKRGVEFFYTKDKNKIKAFTKENMINVKMASGFEKATLSASFKIALCKAYSLSFAFLDEIDAFASDSNSEKLFNSIITNDIFDQLFIITHKSSTQDAIRSIASGVQVYYVNDGVFKEYD